MSVKEKPGAEAPEVPPLSRNRDFRLLWIGAGSSLLGVRVAVSAYPLLMLWSGGSAADAGLVGFAALLPQLFLLLPAGALIDRWNRRRVMIVCDVIGMTGMASLVAALVAGKLWLPHVMAVAFVEGGAVIVYRLTERAAVRHVVHPSHLSAAFSQNEARGHAAGLMGQPVGSGLFTVSRWLPFCVAAVTHVIALVTLLFIRKDFQSDRERGPSTLRADIKEGVVWVWRQRFMRAAIVLVGGSNLAFQLISLALVLIIRDGGHPAYMVGAIGLLGGIGGVLGAMSASWVGRRLPVQTILIGSLALWAALMLAVAFVHHPFALGALMAGMSGAGALLNVTAGVYQVQVTPDAMQGRASSVFSLVGSGLNAFGALVGGVLLTAFGSQNAVIATAAMMAVLALAALATPAVRRPPSVKPEQV